MFLILSTLSFINLALQVSTETMESPTILMFINVKPFFVSEQHPNGLGEVSPQCQCVSQKKMTGPVDAKHQFTEKTNTSGG